MKTRKLLSLLAVAVMSFSAVAVTANAEKVNENPVASVEVGTVTSAGKAALDVYFNIDAELEAYSAIENDDLETIYSGKALQQIEIAFTVNGDLFDVNTLTLSGSHTLNGAQAAVKSDKSVAVAFLPTAPTGWLANNSVKLCRVTVELKDKSITKDQLAAMANIIDFSAFNVNVCAFPEGGVIDNPTGYEQTGYRLDGKSDFIPTVIEGAEVVEPDEPTYNKGTAGNEFDGKASKYWTVNYEAGEFTGTDVIELSDGETTKSINVTTAEGFDIGGAVSFYVYVIGNDIADVYIVE